MANLIGTDPNQVPTNGDLGDLAYQNKESVTIEKATLSADGSNPLTLNRDTSNGDIVTLQKDGSGIGGIGVYDGDVTIYSSQSGHKGLRFGSGYIAPLDNTGAIADNSVDLGLSIARFSNLHLAGGVYLGGTGSANYLDDYEEGTYQVTLTPSSGSFGMDTARDTFRYVKIGNVCHVFGYTRTNTVSSASGTISFNLPFTSASQSEYEGHSYGVSVPENILTVSSNEFAVRNTASSSTATILRTGGGGTFASWGDSADYFQAASNVTITLTYRTA